MRIASVLCLLAIAAPAAAQEPNQRQLLEAFEKQLSATATAAAPSIACVVVSRSEHYPKQPGDAVPGKLGSFDPKEFLKTNASDERAALAKSLDLADPLTIPDHGYSGGVVIDSSGLVLTPYHVIDGATKVYVFLPGGAGSYADIHAADSRSDLAVLKLINPPANLKPIKLGEVRTTDRADKKANMAPGKLVMLMANPYSSSFRVDKPSAVFGSISNVHVRGRALDPNPQETATRYPEYGMLLEYDLKFNERRAAGGLADVTGGVLLNLDGEMVGLTNSMSVAWTKAIGAGYAVPVDQNFHRIVNVLRKGEEVEYGYLGVYLPTSPNSPGANRIIIDRTAPQGPAALAGIESGDVVMKINDVPVSTYDDLLLHIGSSLADTKVKLTVSRAGRLRDVEATLAKFRHEQPYIASVRPEPVFGLRVDHGSILAQRLTMDPRVRASGVSPGLCVREVVPDSPAAGRFKALGDGANRWLITHVNETPTTTPAEFYKAARGQQSVKLTLIDPTELNPRPREVTLP